MTNCHRLVDESPIKITFQSKTELKLYNLDRSTSFFGYITRKKGGKIVRSVEVEHPLVVLDVDEDNEIVGVELIGHFQPGELTQKKNEKE